LDFPTAFISSIVVWRGLAGNKAWGSEYETQDHEFSWHRVSKYHRAFV